MPQTPNQTVVFLMGPTASGKTNLAIQLADTFKARIISCKY
jgi:tRNA dimethylallyltransferase